MSCGRQSAESLKSELGNHLKRELRVLNETGPVTKGLGRFCDEGEQCLQAEEDVNEELFAAIARKLHLVGCGPTR